MAGAPQTQRKNHVKFSAISGLDSYRRNPGRGVEKDQQWPEVISANWRGLHRQSTISGLSEAAASAGRTLYLPWGGDGLGWRENIPHDFSNLLKSPPSPSPQPLPPWGERLPGPQARLAPVAPAPGLISDPSRRIIITKVPKIFPRTVPDGSCGLRNLRQPHG
jgi:hypothetical protein